MVDEKKRMTLDRIKGMNIPVGTPIRITYVDGGVKHVNYQGVKEKGHMDHPELIYSTERSNHPKVDSTFIETIIDIKGVKYVNLESIATEGSDDGLSVEDKNPLAC